MSVMVKRGSGFFTVRSDGVQTLGATWPTGAIGSFQRRKSAAVLARDRVRVSDGYGVDDQLEFARQEVEEKRSKSVAVARYVGKLGEANVYERVYEVLAPDTAPIEMSEVTAKVGDRETKTVHLQIAKSAKTRRIEGFASTPSIDRDNDIVEPTAFAELMPKFMQNPVMLWMHDVRRPVGKIVDFAVREKGLWIAGEIVDEEVWRWIDTEVVRAMSASFIILDRSIEQVGMGNNGEEPTMIRRITKAELLEVSVVTIPANRDALFQVSKCLSSGDDLVCRGCRCSGSSCECAGTAIVVEHRAFKIAGSGPVDMRNEAIAERGGAEAVRQSKLFDAEARPGLLHHGVQGGEVVTSIDAVRAGLAALVGYAPLGAAGMLTEPEREAAWKHLCAHLAEAGEVAPEMPKGPAPERAAKLLGDGGRGTWSICFSVSAFQDEAKCRTWLRAHGFGELQAQKDVGGWRRFGQGSSDELEGQMLEDGVRAVLYRRAEGNAVTVSKDGATDAGATPAAPAAVATPAAPVVQVSAAAPAAITTPVPPVGEEMIEIDSEDLHALEHPDSVDPDALARAVENVVEADAS